MTDRRHDARLVLGRTDTIVGRAEPEFITRLRRAFGDDVAQDVQRRQARDDLLMETAITVDTAAALNLLERRFRALDHPDE